MPLDTRFQRGPQIYVAESEDDRFLELRHGLIEISLVKTAHRKIAIAAEVFRQGFESSTPVAFAERPDFFDCEAFVEFVRLSGFGQAGGGIEDVQLAAHHRAHQRKVGRAPALITTALDHYSFHGFRNLEDLGDHHYLVEKTGSGHNAKAVAVHLPKQAYFAKKTDVILSPDFAGKVRPKIDRRTQKQKGSANVACEFLPERRSLH